MAFPPNSSHAQAGRRLRRACWLIASLWWLVSLQLLALGLLDFVRGGWLVFLSSGTLMWLLAGTLMPWVMG